MEGFGAGGFVAGGEEEAVGATPDHFGHAAGGGGDDQFAAGHRLDAGEGEVVHRCGNDGDGGRAEDAGRRPGVGLAVEVDASRGGGVELGDGIGTEAASAAGVGHVFADEVEFGGAFEAGEGGEEGVGAFAG